jgi:hypothetical protein
MFDKIKLGDTVTIVTRFGKEVTGRAVRPGPWGWMLMDGDTPVFANSKNVTRVNEAKGPHPEHTKTQMSKETQASLDSYFGERREATDIIFRFSRAELVTFFRFLDELREGGTTNMFGAYPILAEAFGLSAEDAKVVQSRWTETYREGWSAEERVSRSMGWRGHEGFECYDWRQ